MAQQKTKTLYHRIHTRKLDRGVAKVKMKKAGMTQICKKGRGNKHDSYFALHWDEFID